MLETMYAVTELVGTDAESVEAFASRYVKNDEMEEEFYAAIRDSRINGFREGVKAALMLFAEVR